MSNNVMMQYFEWNMPADGSHWKKLQQEAPKLALLGIHGVWIPPPTKGSSKDDVGYGVYDLWDLGEFDQKGTVGTKYGTKQELEEACKACKTAGVQVYADAVLNHKLGGDDKETFKAVEVDPNNRVQEVSEGYDITSWTKFSYPGRNGKYSQFQWGFQHFTGTDYNEGSDKNVIYRILGENKGWSWGVDGENSNYDYLMGCDVDYSHPDVVEETKKWAMWIINELGLQGFRFDALKHIDAPFIKELVEYVKTETKNPNFFCVGEYWKNDMESLEQNLSAINYGISLFDVPLHYNFAAASNDGKNYDMRQIFDGTLVKDHPLQAVTFVDNHDSQPGESLDSWIQDWFKPIAYAIILLRAEGYPCVFYGDFYGISGENPIPGKPEILTKLLLARKLYSYGEQNDYFDHESTVGWVRRGNKESQVEEEKRGLAVVVCSSEGGEKRMFVGEENKGQNWIDLLGHVQDSVTIDDEGFGNFRANGGSLSVWAFADNPLNDSV